MERARLTRYGLLSVKGDDARDFLHAQLTNDIEHLSAEHAAAGFHARRSARSKLYRYVLDTGPVQLPTRRRLLTARHSSASSAP